MRLKPILLFQMAHDSDSFNRWEAAQTCGAAIVVAAYHRRIDIDVATASLQGLGQTLDDPTLDNAFKALMLQLPGEAEITAALGKDVDADARAHSRDTTYLRTIATESADRLLGCFANNRRNWPYQPDTAEHARRSLRLRRWLCWPCKQLKPLPLRQMILTRVVI